nr:retrovirus-related Pol polyprotein from transposon TNT 1-94 [Tanacetum cinerariifolium]
MGKTISKLHALLIEYEKGIPKKAATPQVLTNEGGRIQKPNTNPQATKGKGKGKVKDTPQHNGVFERRNRTLLDMVRSMTNLTTLPLSFWDYTLESATRILNMVLTKKFDKTPYEIWYGKVLNLSYLKVWVCKALVKRDTPGKLQQRSIKCIFIGCVKEIMGYHFYFLHENKVVVARSERTHRALGRLCLNVEVKEYSLGDLNEPTNYKAALSDLEFDK